MKARAASPDVLVDLNRLDELRAITRRGRHARARRDGDLHADHGARPRSTVSRPILAEVAAQIADVQVRNRGTIGGNVCSNDPTNHLPPLLVALGATMTIRGADGERTVPAEEFFLGVYMTAVGEGELLTSISRPGGRRTRRTGSRRSRSAATAPCIVNAAASLAGGDGADRARLRRRRAGPARRRPAPTRTSVREGRRRRGARPAVRRARLGRLPPPPRRGLRRARRRAGSGERTVSVEEPSTSRTISVDVNGDATSARSRRAACSSTSSATTST